MGRPAGRINLGGADAQRQPVPAGRRIGPVRRRPPEHSMKKLFGFLRRERETLQCRVLIYFLEDDLVVPQVEWVSGRPGPEEWCRCTLFYYARMMFELAERNETRVARELMEFVNRIKQRLLDPAGGSRRITIPLGKLRLGKEVTQPSQRLYQATLYANRQGGQRLDFTGMLGKEKFYLPASFLALLQHVILVLPEEDLATLARRLDRLHQYYRFKKDFWNSAALSEGPRLAMANDTISEPDPEFDAS